MLGSLETKINQIDQESNCGNNLPPAPSSGTNTGTREPIFPNPPAPRPGAGTGGPSGQNKIVIGKGNGSEIQQPPMKFKGGKKTKRRRSSFRKSRRGRR